MSTRRLFAMIAVLAACDRAAPSAEDAILSVTEVPPLSQVPTGRGRDLADTAFGRAVQQAVGDGPTLRAARATEAAAAADVATAEAGFGPTFGIGLSAGASSDDGADLTPTATWRYPLYDGGATAARVASAEANSAATEAQTVERIAARAMQAAEAWQSVYLNGQLRDLADETVGRVQLISDRIAQRQRAGTGRQADVLRAASAMGIALANQAEMRGRVSQSETRAVELFGELPQTTPLPLAGAPGAGFDRSPNIAILQAEVRAARNAIDAAEAARRPRLSFDVTGALADGSDPSLRAGLSVDYLVSSSGARLAAANAARARHKQVLAELDLMRARVSREASELAAQEAALKSTLDAARANVAAASAALEDAEAQFDLGRVGLTDILDLGSALDQSRKRALETESAWRLAGYKRLLVSGDLLSVLGICVVGDCP